MNDVEKDAAVCDARLDLAAVADDARILHESIYLCCVECGDALRVKSLVGTTEILALVQDRRPRESRLKRLQEEELIECVIVVERDAPLLVMVLDIDGIIWIDPCTSSVFFLHTSSPLSSAPALRYVVF